MHTERARCGGTLSLRAAGAAQKEVSTEHVKLNVFGHGDVTAPAPSLHSEDRSDGMMTREGMATEGIAGEAAAARTGEPALPVRGSGGGL